MKTVSATCIIKENRIYNLTVNDKGRYTTLVRYDFDDKEKPYLHQNIKGTILDILSILKSNGFRVRHVDDFGARWYDIQFIDLDNPCVIHKYSIPLK